MPDRHELARLAKAGPVNPESLAIRSQQARRLRRGDSGIAAAIPHHSCLRDSEGLTDEKWET